MNTPIKITVYSNLGTICTYDLMNKAFEKFDYVMKKFSRFDPNSELSRFNNSQELTQIVDKELFELINKSFEIANLSNGLYDPTIIDYLESYGFTQKKIIAYTKEDIENITATRPKYSEIKLDKEKLSITKKQKQRIDLGSIAKGYAVDLAANVLNEAQNFMINAGGDVMVNGNINDRPWKIGLTKDEKNIFGYIESSSISLASSGSWSTKFQEFHHLINPLTGTPENTVEQAFVVHNDAHMADAYATMLFLTGREGLSILEKMKVGGMITKEDEAHTNSFFPEIKNV